MNLSTTSTMKNVTRQQIGINKIPTIINARFTNLDMQNATKTKLKHPVPNLVSLPDVIINFIY